MDDYYRILGVEKSASIDEIKKSYRKLAMEYHPDHTNGDKVSEDEKKNIEDAIQKLRDAIAGDSLETINSAKEALMQISHKMAEEMYKQAQAEEATGADTGQAGAQPDAETSETESSSDSGGAVDADFEVVDEDKK